jgi:hypothetical protein
MYRHNNLYPKSSPPKRYDNFIASFSSAASDWGRFLAALYALGDNIASGVSQRERGWSAAVGPAGAPPRAVRRPRCCSRARQPGLALRPQTLSSS